MSNSSGITKRPISAELVRWADIVDGAQYRDADEAVSLVAPATQLTLVIENAKGSETVQRIIRMMRTMPLDAIIADPEIQALYVPLYERHLRSIDIIRRQATCDGGVVYFDLVEQEIEGYNKFIPYYLHPGVGLHGLGEHVEFSDEGVGGIESVGGGAVEAQPGDHLRALRRRRARQSRRHQFPHRRHRPGAQGGCRDRGRIEDLAATGDTSSDPD